MPVGVSATGTKNESRPGNEHPVRPPVRSIYGSCLKRSLEVAGGERSPSLDRVVGIAHERV